VALHIALLIGREGGGEHGHHLGVVAGLLVKLDEQTLDGALVELNDRLLVVVLCMGCQYMRIVIQYNFRLPFEGRPRLGWLNQSVMSSGSAAASPSMLRSNSAETSRTIQLSLFLFLWDY
jgi:hypothetical protein